MPPKKTNKAIAQARFLKESKNPALDIAKKGKIAKNIDSYHPQKNDWKGVDTPGSKLPSKKRKAPPKSSVPVAKKAKTAKKATGKKPVKKAKTKKSAAPKKATVPKPPKKKVIKAPAKPVKPKPAPIAAVSEAVKSIFSPIPTAPPTHLPPGWDNIKNWLGVDYPYRIQFKSYKEARCGFYLRDGKYLMDGEYWEDYYGQWKVSDMAGVKGGKYNLFQKMPGDGLNRYAMQRTVDGKKSRVIDLMSFSVETAAEKADYPKYGSVKLKYDNPDPYSFDKVMLDWIAGLPEPLDQVTKDWKSFVATTPQYWSLRPSGELTVFRGHHDVPDIAKTKVGGLKKFTSDRPTSWSSNVCVSTRFADGGGYHKKQTGYVLMMRVPVDKVVADLRFLDPQFVTGIIGALEDEVIVKPGIYPTEVIWTTKKKGKPKHVFELLKTNATY